MLAFYSEHNERLLEQACVVVDGEVVDDDGLVVVVVDDVALVVERWCHLNSIHLCSCC